jgi:hypothetical protein
MFRCGFTDLEDEGITWAGGLSNDGPGFHVSDPGEEDDHSGGNVEDEPHDDFGEA